MSELKTEIYLLGTGCAIPQKKRAGPAVLLIADSTGSKEIILFDLGRGTLDKLANLDIDFTLLDYLLFTHYHPDHTAELVNLLFAYRDTRFGRKREKEFFIYGPKGLLNFYNNLCKVYNSKINADNYTLFIKEIEKEIFTSSTKISFQPVEHTEESIGYRVTLKNGKAFVYSGDTGYSRGIVNLANNADLLLLECAFPEEYKKEDHLTPSLAGQIAAEAKVKKLVLTHFYPLFQGINIYDRCRKYYSGEIVIGEDLMRFTI
ncbi:MAG TPA: hypothetical protein DHV62_08760 [Elusimicrobia bacterium]|nr:hypothetical protein [Elusimicrobiota bacterium]